VPVETLSLVAAWKRYVPWARVLLGLAVLASGLAVEPKASPIGLAGIGAFLAFSAFVGLRKQEPSRPFGLLVLFADLVFFMVLAWPGLGSYTWLRSVYYLYMALEAVAFYNAREVLMVVGLSAIFCGLVAPTDARPLRRTTVIAGAMAYAFAVYKRKLEQQNEDLAREAARNREEADHAREAERQRIASDFHDGPLQSFISLQMRLQILRKILERDVHGGMADLEGLQALATQQVKELRAFVRSMRPLELDGSNLFVSLRRICENFQKESGVPVTVVGGEGPLRLSEDVAAEVVQMLREALHNVLKHAGATRVAVSIERTGKTLEISVDDNGRGFHFSGVYTLDELELLRLGPASLKRRARALNAEMTIESRPGRGAGLALRVPIA
jgi:signal transduction histidine kinase